MTASRSVKRTVAPTETASTGPTAASPAEEFFAELNRRGHEPLLAKTTSTIGFDLVRGTDTEHWLMRIDHGDIRVSHDESPVDCSVRLDGALFDGFATGRMNAMAAMLRNAPQIKGDLGMLVLIQRLFPGPPATRDRGPAREGKTGGGKAGGGKAGGGKAGGGKAGQGKTGQGKTGGGKAGGGGSGQGKAGGSKAGASTTRGGGHG